jgi:hypothetical protein
MAVLNGDGSYGTSVDGSCWSTDDRDHIWWDAINFKNAATKGHYKTGGDPQAWVFSYCIAEDCGAGGIESCTYYGLMWHCILRNNTGAGAGAAYDSWFGMNLSHGNGAYGLISGRSSGFAYNLTYDNGDAGLHTADAGLEQGLYVGNVCDDNVQGIEVQSRDYPSMIIGNRCTNNDEYGIKGLWSGEKMPQTDFNLCHGNGSGATVNIIHLGRNDFSPASDGYKDDTAHDYRLLDSAELNGKGDDSLTVLDWSDSPDADETESYVQAGLPQKRERAGGGRPFVNAF